MAGGQRRGLVLFIAGGQRAHRLVAVEQDCATSLNRQISKPEPTAGGDVRGYTG